MELKPGYKQTEVGVIPEEWDVREFRNQFSISAGGDVKPALSLSEQDTVHCFPIYSNALTNNGLYGYCSYADHPAESITITARGTLGVATYRDHRYTAIGRVLVLEPKHESAGRFFAEFINGRIKFAIESTGVPQLTAPQINGYLLAVPPPPEQRAIATALSDVDALLGGLDRLIAKKRDLKQAAMQQLLTGQTRLPGFHGEWEVKRLGDHVACLRNGTNSRAELTQDDPLKPGYKQTEVGVIPEEWDVREFRNQFSISAGGDVKPALSLSEQDTVHCFPIYSNALTNNGLYGYCSYADHPAESITITARGTLGVATYRDHRYTAIGRVLVLEPKHESAGRFFAEFINGRIKFAIESTGVPQLTAPQINGYLLAVPPPPEQRAIATALSDVDALLGGLDRLIAKKRDLKQAMMQELLTGKTRLVPAGAAHA